ncbi:MAG: hypothetical protein IPN96_19540 [Anaerolineales bacterium]|nr:hypothetical protein [Anaerolineales bacterium]
MRGEPKEDRAWAQRFAGVGNARAVGAMAGVVQRSRPAIKQDVGIVAGAADLPRSMPPCVFVDEDDELAISGSVEGNDFYIGRCDLAARGVEMNP